MPDGRRRDFALCRGFELYEAGQPRVLDLWRRERRIPGRGRTASLPVPGGRSCEVADQILRILASSAGVFKAARENARGVHDLLRHAAAAFAGGRADDRPAGAEAHGAGAFL